MAGGASIPLLIVTVGDAILVGLAPMENYSPSDSLKQLSLLLALSLLSPVLPLASFFIAILSIRQIARSQGTQKGQGLAWAAIALSSISLLFFIATPPVSSAHNTSLEPTRPAVRLGLARYWDWPAGRLILRPLAGGTILKAMKGYRPDVVS